MSLFEDYHIQDHACSKECYQIGQRLSVLGNVKSLNLTKKEKIFENDLKYALKCVKI